MPFFLGFVLLNTWKQARLAVGDWFFNPPQVLIPLACIALALLLLGQGAWKRWLLQAVLALVLAYGLLLSPLGTALLTKGLTCFLPIDPGTPVDAVVVLGRGFLSNTQRADLAAALWQQGRSSLIVVSGQTQETAGLIQRLIASGVPKQALIGEYNSQTTADNARLTAPLLRQRRARRIILVTDAPHMLRSWLTFRRFQFEVIPKPVALPKELAHAQVRAIVLREYPALLSYLLLGRLQIH